ncbi:hypothetical protein [Nocardioides sp.]|uniref:hypothetical protein n=1 Tax=Nocardioides sp. TaxID=35761 RepID=UPI00272546D8|nr:hypothetical protein [Nocardioides sp.]MDO9457252.1 hypothetical protein [Nocardioides sp.]
MGYQTDFVGHIDIAPPLNDAETAYLTAFTRTRHFDRPEGPYFVSSNPYAEARDEKVAVETYNRTAAGQPELWCHWVPCGDGDCLTYDGIEKPYAPVEWMRYLVQHFFSSRAAARHRGDPAFAEFTFDHVLNGTIVGCRRDTRELFAIDVRNNRVSKRVLQGGDPPPWAGKRLPYEEALDRRQERGARRNRNLTDAGGQVVDLTARRG